MENKISGLLITGLLAVLGTVAGGVVKGYWDTSLARIDFQSSLILRALEPEDAQQRIASLRFLVETNLISDPAVRDGLNKVLEEGGTAVPRFLPIGVEASIGGSGVDQVGSARDQLVRTHPRLQGKRVALIGFRVRHGDVIDALTPIYAEVTETLELVGEYEGKRIGGTGG